MRIKVNVPVKIFTMSGNTYTWLEDAVIVNLGKHGACLMMTGRPPEPGQPLFLETPHRGVVAAEVRWTGDPSTGALRPAGVYYSELAAEFGYAIPAIQPSP